MYRYEHILCECMFVCLLVGCLTSQQQANVSPGPICSDMFTCCHTEIEVANQTFYLTQSQYTDTGPTSPSVDPISPDAWQGCHWSANFWVTGMTRPGKSCRKQDLNPGSSALEADTLTTRPSRRCACMNLYFVYVCIHVGTCTYRYLYLYICVWMLVGYV